MTTIQHIPLKQQAIGMTALSVIDNTVLCEQILDVI